MRTPESIVPGAEKKMVGSIFICEADSLEAVRKLMENDVYYTSGVVSVLFASPQCAFLMVPSVVGQGEVGDTTLSSRHRRSAYSRLNIMDLDAFHNI